MQGSFSVLSIKLYRMLYIGIKKAANTLFQQKRGDLYFAEKGFVKPKIRYENEERSGFGSAFSVLQTLISFCRVYEACPLGGLFILY